MDYALGDKPAALADFRQALQMDPMVWQPGPRLRAILEDQEFVRQLFPQK